MIKRPMSKESTPTKSTSGDGKAESPAHLTLRIVAVLIGLPLSALAVGAWFALLIENAWVAFGVGSAVVILPTLLLVDRLLPADDPRKGRGIPTDVLSMVWLGFAVLCFGPLGFLLDAPLAAFCDRVDTSGTARSVFAFLTEDTRPEASRDTPAEVESFATDAGPSDAGDQGPSDSATPGVGGHS